MKRAILFTALLALSALSAAQSLTTGGGAVSGSGSGSRAAAFVAIGTAGGVANLGAVAKNEGTAVSGASTGLVVAPIPALVSAGTATSQNTTTITTTGTVPAGAAGAAGGTGAGYSFAAGGVIYYLTTTTPGPVAPTLLPNIGGSLVIVPLPALPAPF
jgi:hypothetical protein